eukprot:GHVN01091764.1.p1 GENE.GHVN01091764.1~~GHVN01091764.1.p1  ORF type:complete len:100 (-),score=2.99 GHVN01091764.1:594-893(-)
MVTLGTGMTCVHQSALPTTQVSIVPSLTPRVSCNTAETRYFHIAQIYRSLTRESCKKARAQFEAAQQRSKERYDAKQHPFELDPGDLVMVRNSRSRQSI